MEPQGYFCMYPKKIIVAVTREGERVACVYADGFLGGKITISKEQWLEIGRILEWKTAIVNK